MIEEAIVFGKTPPQSTDIEEAVLGACMIEPRAVNTASRIINPDMMYKPAHQHIFNAILTLYRQSDPIDILTVTERLRLDGKLEEAGGTY